MKRSLFLILALCLLLSLCACGDLRPELAPGPEEPAAPAAQVSEPGPACQPSPTPSPMPAPSAAPTPIPDWEDRPANRDAAPENAWVEVDYERDGVPFDPSAPARDGHTHDWVLVKELSWESTCTSNGRNTLRCSVCGRETSYELPRKEHSYYWQSDSSGCRHVCSVCYDWESYDDINYSPHSWVQEGDKLVCSRCGYVGRGYTGGGTAPATPSPPVSNVPVPTPPVIIWDP